MLTGLKINLHQAIFVCSSKYCIMCMQCYQGILGLRLWCSMTSGLSKDIGVMHDHTFSKLANHQIRHKVDCRAGGGGEGGGGDCIWPL